MRAELRRSIFLACVGLLAGFALVVTLYGAGTLFKRGLGSPTGLGPPDGPAEPLSAVPPAENGGETAPPPPTARGTAPGEGVAPPAGKPRAALEARQAPDRGQTPPAGAQPPGGEAPTFDIIRIEPDGEAVIAGRAPPNTTVELLRDNTPIARALVDPSGQFAIVPSPLPAGNSEITLRVTGADGQSRVSRDSVAVVVASDRAAKPLIALTSPDKPTIVLSQPDPVMASKPGAGNAVAAKPSTAKPGDRLATNMPGSDGAASAGRAPEPSKPAKANGNPEKPAATAPEKTPSVKIVSVEAEEGGRLYVTSQAQPGATVRLYLNDALVAPGSVGADGRVAFTIGRGVRPGDYRIRVDQVDPVSGTVKARSEVAFVVPVAVTKPTAPQDLAALAPRDTAGAPARPAPNPVARAGSPETPPAPKVAPAPVTPPAPTAEAASPRAAAMTPSPAVPNPPVAETRPADPTATAAAPHTVFVPEVGTARIIRGDSLWQISRRIYGKGTRFTVIFDANQPQIRNPDLIYPGQIFVLPRDGAAAEADRQG